MYAVVLETDVLGSGSQSRYDDGLTGTALTERYRLTYKQARAYSSLDYRSPSAGHLPAC